MAKNKAKKSSQNLHRKVIRAEKISICEFRYRQEQWRSQDFISGGGGGAGVFVGGGGGDHPRL